MCDWSGSAKPCFTYLSCGHVTETESPTMCVTLCENTPENIPDASHHTMCVCVCVCASVCVCYTAGINMVIGEDCVSCFHVLCMHTRRRT